MAMIKMIYKFCAPIYQGVAGINALNLVLQEIFNPKNHQEEYRIGHRKYIEKEIKSYN